MAYKCLFYAYIFTTFLEQCIFLIALIIRVLCLIKRLKLLLFHSFPPYCFLLSDTFALFLHRGDKCM